MSGYETYLNPEIYGETDVEPYKDEFILMGYENRFEALSDSHVCVSSDA